MWHLLFINIYYWHKYSTIKYVNQNKKPIFSTDINLIWDMHCTWKGHHARAHFLKQCQIQLYESDLHPITLISSDLWNSRNSSFITPMADRYHINYISHVYLFQPVIFLSYLDVYLNFNLSLIKTILIWLVVKVSIYISNEICCLHIT